jgi:predicted HTH transcriptional regulator
LGVKSPIAVIPNPINIQQNNCQLEIGYLGRTQQAIVDMMKENGKITTTEISKQLNLSRKSVTKHLSVWKDLNIVVREGSDSIGKWILKGVTERVKS